jgi:para-nitrobenzyl esterase
MLQRYVVWVKKQGWKIFVALVVGALTAELVQWKTHKTATFFARTSQGVVQGVMVEDVNAFLGIPYAAVPVGELRWKKPGLPQRWSGVLAANKVPAHCVQSIFGFDRGQEDCLYLNVWTPSLFPQKPLPVMVWIHGGGFTVGHSYETSPGHRLAKQGDVIVVSMNYRLGALGFMAHPDLTQEAGGASGNYAVLDQLHALNWVRRNIKNFGGDPDNVTIFGESAGGMSVCNLLVSPLARGLFDKAIIQSGPCFSSYPDLAFMEKQGLTMEQKLGCDKAETKLDCMRSKSSAEILAAMPPAPGMVFGEEEEYWMPNIDGQLLAEQPLKSLREGQFEKVPIINGSNADEGTLLVMFGHEYQFKKLTPEKYPLNQYKNAGEALSAVFGDHTFACHEKWTTEALAKQTPVYSYYFSYPEADFVLPKLRDLGAFHGAELQFIFNYPMAWLESKFGGKEKMLSDNMMNYWTQFAHTGNPNGEVDTRKTTVHWPEYGATGQRLQLDTTLAEKPGADTDAACDFWRSLASENFIE